MANEPDTMKSSGANIRPFQEGRKQPGRTRLAGLGPRPTRWNGRTPIEIHPERWRSASVRVWRSQSRSKRSEAHLSGKTRIEIRCDPAGDPVRTETRAQDAR